MRTFFIISIWFLIYYEQLDSSLDSSYFQQWFSKKTLSGIVNNFLCKSRTAYCARHYRLIVIFVTFLGSNLSSIVVPRLG